MMVNLRKSVATSTALAALVVGLLGMPARAAVVLNPGQSGVTVPLDDTSISGPAVATSTLTSGFPTGVSVTESVYQVGAAYDFVFQVANLSGYTLNSLTVSYYGSYATSVGYEDTSGSALHLQPLPYTASRDGSGATGQDITFTFGGGLSTGLTTVPIFVLTNASGYDSAGAGGMSLVSGSNSYTSGVSGTVYEPTGATVPEPSSIALLGCLATVGGIGTIIRSRTRKAA